VHRAVGGALAALLMAAPAAWGQASGAISGRLVDRATHAPVVGAEVFVLGQHRPVMSDSNGAFLYRLASGEYLLQVRQIGYIKAEWTVEVPEGEIVELLLQLEPIAFVLPPAVIEGRPEDLPTWFRGFEDRRVAKRGQFLTRAEIERRDPSVTLGNLLRTLNGLRMYCSRGGCNIRMTRWSNCQPLYYQDGLPVFAGTAEGFVAMDIHGIEVYGLSDVPVEFQRPGLRCGVIAIWTRRGPPPRGKRRYGTATRGTVSNVASRKRTWSPISCRSVR